MKIRPVGAELPTWAEGQTRCN